MCIIFRSCKALFETSYICGRNGYSLEEWGVAIVIPILYKRGDKENCEHYRGIRLLCAAYKLYTKIISKRISVISELLLKEEQNGFRRGRSCMDSIHIYNSTTPGNT
jgi:hypothetical protein